MVRVRVGVRVCCVESGWVVVCWVVLYVTVRVCIRVRVWVRVCSFGLG